MNRTFIAAVACATAIAVSTPAFARGAMQNINADYRSWGTPHATASVSGRQQKTLLHKENSGHYSVCNHGSHALTVSYDASSASVDSGDCMAVQAKKISVKGTDNGAFNRAFVFNHTHFHPHHSGR